MLQDNNGVIDEEEFRQVGWGSSACLVQVHSWQ
jgi:hypothetical protein